MRIYLFCLLFVSIFRVYAQELNYVPGQSINPYSPIFYNVCNIDNGYATMVINKANKDYKNSTGILLKADLVRPFVISGIAFIANIDMNTGKRTCLKSNLNVSLSNYYIPVKYSSGGGIDLYMMPGSRCDGTNCTLAIEIVPKDAPLSASFVTTSSFLQP
jgi:hypothetical protein